MKKKQTTDHVKNVCEDMHFKESDLKWWGLSNTPLNDKNTDKNVLIDWISYTFSDVDYDELFNTNTQTYDIKIRKSDKNSFILNSILKLMNIDQFWESIKITNRALNGYRFSWEIGESIRINFGGPKMLDDNHSTQLLFSGSACREFEDYYKGSFIELFNFLFDEHKELGYYIDDNGEIISAKKFNGSFKRIDIAIDDLTGKEQNIYDLKAYADKHWWVGSYKSVNIYESSIRNGDVESKGFSITFGSPASNQLIIYDKRLERKSKSIEYFGSDTWYRYEMRFVQDKADKVVRYFRTYHRLNKLNEYVLGLLNSCIEFKQIRNGDKVNFSRQYIQSQPTLESWNKFIEYNKKIKLDYKNIPILTIDKKLEWLNNSLTTTFAELYLINKDNINAFNDLILKFVNKGLFKLNEKHLTAVNKYLQRKNKERITDDEYLRYKSYGLLNKGGK